MVSGRDAQSGQGFLFGEPNGVVRSASSKPEWVTMAKQLPAGVRLGTSSWTYPGWKGLIYDEEYSASELAEPAGLAAYARHSLMRTVGLDRAFYAYQSREQYAELRAAVPAGFRFLVKANQLATRPTADEQGRTQGNTANLHAPNALFLDPLFVTERIIAPAIEGLGDACGPIVFQFPPLDLSAKGPLGGAAKVIDRLDRFLSKLPQVGAAVGGTACIALELRNKELICKQMADVLVAHGAVPGYVHRPRLPSVDAQAAIMGAASTTLVCRWLLRHDLQYEAAGDKYKPFNRIVDADGPTLTAVAGLVREAVKQSREAYVIVSNKAEGSSPLTVARLAHAVITG